jgi:phospholipase C
VGARPEQRSSTLHRRRRGGGGRGARLLRRSGRQRLGSAPNDGTEPRTFALSANAYFGDAHESVTVAAGDDKEHRWSLASSSHWYDFTVRVAGLDGWSRRFAGRVETGRPSFSDPAQGGRARGER